APAVVVDVAQREALEVREERFRVFRVVVAVVVVVGGGGAVDVDVDGDGDEHGEVQVQVVEAPPAALGGVILLAPGGGEELVEGGRVDVGDGEEGDGGEAGCCEGEYFEEGFE